MTRTIALAGTPLELVERGQGRPLLFLHAGEGLAPERPWLDLLSRRYRVIAPLSSRLWQLAADRRRRRRSTTSPISTSISPPNSALTDAVLVGADLGGWIAAEMMVRSSARFSRLVLTAPLGIKLRGRDERDIADIHAMTPAEYLRLAWADAGTAMSITPRCRTASWRRSCAAARPLRSTAGSPTCTIRA